MSTVKRKRLKVMFTREKSWKQGKERGEKTQPEPRRVAVPG